MRKRHLGLLLIGLSLVGIATPDAILNVMEANTGPEESASAGGLQERRGKYLSGLSNRSSQVNYLDETKAAITRALQAKGRNNFEVSKIVFTSEKSKTIAGQRQVALSFTYQLQYQKGPSQKRNGSILLVSDGAGNWFDSAIKI